MKRNFLLILSFALAFSCTKEAADNTDVKKSAEYTDVIIKAEQVSESKTKTIRNSDKTVSWLAGEEINVICGSDMAKFTSTNTEPAKIASFSGQLLVSTVIGATEGTENNAYIWGLYPYDENVESDGTYVTTTLPHEQTGVSGTFDDDLFITLAHSKSFNLGFYSVCSGLKFSLTQEGITSITFKGNNNESIAGKACLTFVDGVPSAEVVTGQTTITLTPEGDTFATGVDYYFVILPTTFENGFTVTFNKGEKKAIFNYTSNVSFERNVFKTASNLDEGLSFKTLVNFDDQNFKTYCVTNFDTDGDGEISTDEAKAVSSINVNSKSITSMTGIEAFTSLKYLYCKINQLTSLDVSKNTSLLEFNCSNNQLTSLDVSSNTSLVYLNCDNNNLTSLSLPFRQVQFLYCRNNKFTSLDVSNQINKLLIFYCNNNPYLKTIYISSDANFAEFEYDTTVASVYSK